MKPPYSLIRKSGSSYFLAGHTSTDPETTLTPLGISEQTKACLEAIKATLKSSGLSMDDIVKTTVYLQNIDDFGSMNEEYSKHFNAPYPVRSTVEVACLPKIASNAPLLVEIDAVAYKED